MKRFIVAALLALGVLTILGAQQSITRFAVVDMDRIAAAFSDLSADAKTFNEKRDRVQTEIERQNKELQELNVRLEEARESEKRDLVRTLESQVRSKTQALQNYVNTSFAELERERERLSRNESFITQLNTALRTVAESEGYSMVLSKQEGTGILWYSPSVDITNKVIERIRSGNSKR
ncbi:MAG: OmpH family outer membrane protein [Treponema sp.]|jgi:outer membrane protein|nr:OmpH family outer membrane protein [Treponema sp.]